MTEQQASNLKERIMVEMPTIKVEQARRGSTWWVLKLKNTKIKRELSILHIDEWESVRQVWQS